MVPNIIADHTCREGITVDSQTPLLVSCTFEMLMKLEHCSFKQETVTYNADSSLISQPSLPTEYFLYFHENRFFVLVFQHYVI